MESDEDPRQALADVERSAAAPYVDYPPTPAWYYPVVGLWSAALVMALSLPHDGVVRGLVLVVLIGLEVAFLRWYRRYRGTMPSMRHAPAEIRRSMLGYAVGALLVVGVVVAVALLVSPALAAVLSFVLVSGGLFVYERHYERAAAATRARLS